MYQFPSNNKSGREQTSMNTLTGTDGMSPNWNLLHLEFKNKSIILGFQIPAWLLSVCLHLLEPRCPHLYREIMLHSWQACMAGSLPDSARCQRMESLGMAPPSLLSPEVHPWGDLSLRWGRRRMPKRLQGLRRTKSEDNCHSVSTGIHW